MKNFTRFHKHLSNKCDMSKKQVLFLIAICTSAIGYSQSVGDNFIDNDLLYEITSINPNTVEIISSPVVVGIGISIPATADNNSDTYSVTSIAENAFLGKGYTSITIPSSILSIGSGAFFSNPLTCVISEATTPPSLATSPSDPFGPVRSNIDLTIPTGTASAYAAATWTGFNSVSEGISNTFIVDYITYQITSSTNNTVAVMDYDVSGGTTINIPSTVSSSCNLYTVTSVGNFALDYHNLTSATLPNTLIDIGENAFAFNDLTSITIPDSVITIGDGAFAQNNNMTNVTIGSNVTTIGEYAFRFNNLNSVVIPNSVTTIGQLAFSSNSITNLQLESSLTNLNEHVFSYNNITSVTLPDTIINIADNAFLQNNLTSIVIPDNVTSIGALAFASNDLTNLVIGNSVTNIAANAFNTNDLTSVTIPASVTNIGDSAFYNNPLLVNVISLATIPPTITTGGTYDSFNSDRSSINLVIPDNTTDAYVIDSSALWTGFNMTYEVIPPTTTLKVTYYDSANGTNVSIPSTITDGATTYNVTEIANATFFDKGLTSVTIPDGMITIGVSAFNTNNLTSVIIPDSVITIGSQAFLTNDLNNITIGNNVTNIDFAAFADNNLTDIVIPASVTNIGSVAFIANPLINVTSLATTPPTITTGTNDTFEVNGNRSNIHLHIPAGTMGVYVTDAGALWTGFNPVTEDALSVDEFQLQNAVKIITNPDSLTIKTANSLQLNSYELYSITGAKIKTGTSIHIATSTIAKGIYILKLDFNQGTLVKKVLIK